MRYAWILLALAACGSDNELGGSISESFDLTFDEVLITKQGDDLVVEYLRNVSDPPSKVVKLVVSDTGELDIKADSNIKGDVFREYVTVSRVDGSGGEFPPVESGQVHFAAWQFKDGGDVSGDFNALFDNGRTLDGQFKGSVEEKSLE